MTFTIVEPQVVKVDEEYREYQYPSGNKLYVEDVVEVYTDLRQYQTIKSANGEQYMIAPGWEFITIKPREN